MTPEQASNRFQKMEHVSREASMISFFLKAEDLTTFFAEGKFERIENTAAKVSDITCHGGNLRIISEERRKGKRKGQTAYQWRI